MKFYLRQITIPKPPPPPDSLEYREGAYKYDSEIVAVNGYVDFATIEAANEHYAEVYGCEVFLEWYPEKPKYLTK